VELFANGVSLGVKEAEDHFFYFDVPNTGVTELVAKAGDLMDESVIRKVSEPNPDYILKEKGAVLNWWDITEVDGFASLNTKIRFLNAKLGLEGTAKLLAPVMGEQFAAHPQAMGQLDSFTVLRMISLVTGAMMMPVTKEQLLDLNAQLNQISIV
jgi:beta-galactosidase